jgi:hypothetical protein
MKTGITINDQPIEIPASWDEVTFGQAIAMKAVTSDADVLAIFTGLGVEVCNQIDPDILAVILQPFSTTNQPEIKESVQILGKFVPSSIGKLEFARKANCDALNGKYEDEEMVGRMVAIYCAEGIEDEDIADTFTKLLDQPFTDVLSAGKLISNQLIEMQKNEATIKSPEYESAEFSAGIGDFKKYGVFGLVRSIALRWGCTKDDVFKWSYNSVLLELRYSADESAYQRKLNRILNPKK